ncbi:Mannitol 2-dehydrogenase (M2DH) (MDH) [Durusdinium trenchii]|uniref:mannitol 2-dehydrogenase n=1 Tax=Durusdinium trenchii TaxID=1381693 RepID=A0ABP0LB70_9DINO
MRFGEKVTCPKYDREKVEPGIVHIGVGNFHRAHQCVFVDDSLSLPGHESWGYRGIGLMPADAKMRDVLKEQDMMFTLWQKGTSFESVRVIGCHSDFILAPESPEKVLDALCAAETKIVTMTITEKGYFVDFTTGKLDSSAPAVSSDLEALKSGSASLKTALGYLVAAAKRRQAEKAPGFVILSCDNLQENGCKAKAAVLEMAGEVDSGLKAWISENVQFPNSMVDRITPATTEEVKTELKEKYGVEDGWPVVSEEFLLWVVEDKFPSGRPSWDKSPSGKCLFVEDVLPYELLKLRLLNAVHQALAYPASLLGHEVVHEAMADSRVFKFLKAYMAAAGQTVRPVKGLKKDEWSKTVLERFSNPAVRDTIFRLNEDATNRIAVALAPCLQEDAVPPGRSLSRKHLAAILLPVACWIRALVGGAELPAAAKLNRDDKGESMRGPAGEAWEKADGSEAAEASKKFLHSAFGEKVARDTVAEVLAESLKLLKGEGVEALLRTADRENPPIKLKKPKFQKISDLEPEAKGVNVYGQVLTKAESLYEDAHEISIGDSSGTVTLRIRGDKYKACSEGKVVRVQNARVVMSKGHMQLLVDKWSALKEEDHDVGEVNKKNDLSAIEYELVKS